MASKHRITVNLSSKELYDIIDRLAKTNDTSKSNVIEGAIKSAFIKGGDSFHALTMLTGEYMKNRNDIPLKALRNTLSLSITGINGGKVNSLGGYEKRVKTIKLLLDMNPEMDIRIPLTVEQKLTWGQISDMVKQEFEKCIPSLVNELDAPPEALHIFLRQIDIKYHIDDKRVADITVMPTVAFLPIYINDYQKEHLNYFDFNGISYKSFSAVATKGWPRDKYSHLLYIDDMASSKSGGYFINVCHEKQERLYPSSKGFTPHSYREDPNVIVHCKYYIHSNNVKIKKATLPQRPLQLREP
ncbi:hypothetical protein ACSZMR_21605 [Aeromonas veronii]